MSKVSFNVTFDIDGNVTPEQQERIGKMLQRSINKALNYAWQCGNIANNDYYDDETNPGIEGWEIEKGVWN